MIQATKSRLATDLRLSRGRMEEEWLLGLTDQLPPHLFISEAKLLLTGKAERVASTGIAAIRNWQQSDRGKLGAYFGSWLDHYDIAIPDLDDLVFEVIKLILGGSSEKTAIRTGLRKVGVPESNIKKVFKPLPSAPVSVQAIGGAAAPSTAQVAQVIETIGQDIRSNLFLDSVRDAGIEQWQWKTVNDDRVDEVCEALDGQVFDIDEKFAKAHIGCRCFPAAFYATKEFNEEDHPRDASGKFTSGGGDVNKLGKIYDEANAKYEMYLLTTGHFSESKAEELALKKNEAYAKLQSAIQSSGEPGSGKTETMVRGELMSKEDWSDSGSEWADTMDRLYDEEDPDIGTRMQSSLTAYGGNEYKPINGALRGRNDMTPHIQERINSIDAAIEVAPPLDQDTRLYRGMIMTQSEIDSITPGKHLDYEAYTSSSIDADVAESFATSVANKYSEEPVLVIVQTPAGAKLGPLVMSPSADQEAEMLFPRDSKFIITEKDSVTSKPDVYGETKTVHYLYAQYAGDPRINTSLPVPDIKPDVQPPDRSEVLVGIKAKKPKLDMKRADKYVWRFEDVKITDGGSNGTNKRKGKRSNDQKKA